MQKIKKFYKLARHSFWILRREGLLSLVIITLISIQTKQRKKTNKFKNKINVVVAYADAIQADLSAKHRSWNGSKNKQLTFNWIMPPPGKGSGGHLNIFRFIKFLEEAGHTCKIYLYSETQHGPISGIRAVMGSSYPELAASMEWIETGEDMTAADGIFATSWETAYASYNSNLSGRRFYFVQDFEPFFYPLGSHFVLAENTYKFGFYGITAGGWLAKKLNRDYGMPTDYFNFGADRETYRHTESGKRREILFYARPFTERRGFQMGIMALDIFHQMHPEYIINMAGSDVSDYDIPFPFNNLDTLEIEELSEVYNRCAAALVISLTNMSLLPLELLSCGTIPIVNDGENNRLVSNNPHIAYAASDPNSLAKKLSQIVSRGDLTAYAKQASDSVKLSSWTESGKKFVDIVERETRQDD